MSRGYNKIQLIGRVGTDPEMRYTPSGKSVTQFRLAVNRRRREGEAEEADWFGVICWERLAEIADQYVTKGAPVFVEGRLMVRRYTAKDGSQGTAVEVVANELLLLGGKGDGERVAAGGQTIEVDDLPF